MPEDTSHTDCNCGCAPCSCPVKTKPCVIVDYSYAVDPDMPFSRKFNQNGTPEELVRDALQQAHNVVIARSKIPKKCMDKVCGAIAKREQAENAECPSPCIQALIDKLTRCIIAWAIFEYVKDVGHDDFRNPNANKADIEKRIQMWNYYEKEAESVLDNEDIDNFLLTAKKSDYDTDNPTDDGFCFECIDRPTVGGDCLPSKEEDYFDIPLAFI